jgi:hypothetical protein
MVTATATATAMTMATAMAMVCHTLPALGWMVCSLNEWLSA